MSDGNQPRVSLIIPVYNVEEYLERCVDSVLAQTYEDWELILVDDGSTDGSGEICDSYAEEDKRIRVLHQENGKQAAARNAGIDEAGGEYITFSDSDDVLHPEKLAKMVAMAEETEADVVVCPFTYVDEKLHILPWKTERHTGDNPLDSLEARRVFLTTHCIEGVFWNKLIRTQLMKEEGIRFDVNKDIYDDVRPAYELLRKAETVAFVQDSLHSYVQHDDASTNSPDSGQLSEYIDILKEIKSMAEEDGVPQEAAYYFTSRVIQAAHLAYKRRELYTDAEFEDVKKLFPWDRLFPDRTARQIYADSVYFTEERWNRMKTYVKIRLNQKHYG